MVKVKFNKGYNDLKLGRLVEADEEVEMTEERAEEIVTKIRAQSSSFKGYDVFKFEEVEEDKVEDDSDKEKNEGTPEEA